MGMTKDTRQYLGRLRRAGYQIRPVSGRTKAHFQVLRDGRLLVTAGGGTGPRALANLKGEIRKAEREKRMTCAT